MSKESSYKEFIEHACRDTVTPLNNPECKDCNDCCSMGTLLTTDEFERLKKFLRKSKYGRYLYSYGVNLIIEHLRNNSIYWMCPFSHNKRCMIYNKRPAICKNFHCDSNPETNRDFRNSYIGQNHFIVDLFRKDTFDRIKNLRI